MENNLFQDYKYGFYNEDKSLFKLNKGLSKDIVLEISKQKNEPLWMKELRLAAYEYFIKCPMPPWAMNELKEIDFNSISYYAKSTDKSSRTWDDIPQDIKDTYDKIGIPEAEKRFLAGVGAQYDSEIVYHNIKKSLEDKGVIFCSPEEAVKLYPHIVKKYFNTIIPYVDNKFSALNTAVWSGGSFIYVPPNIKVDVPLQAYFRINLESFGQFERTLIIVDENSSLHYIEGCTAPTYSEYSLHSAVVEIIALKGAHVRYSTVQNWSNNVYNLVTKRAVAYQDARIEWVDGNIGSKITMKYPAIYLKGEGSHGEVLSLAMASKNQKHDTGGKILHLANNTSSIINSKSISKDGGISSYRGLISTHSKQDIKNIKSKVNCDALILDDKSVSNTYPYMDIQASNSDINHEASVSKIDLDQIYYLSSRGISQEDATVMIVAGFLDSLTKELPMEYAVELNKLIRLEMEGSIG